jgi:NAD(P)-dependent dehydrogenase (short-subunit alcohol dehydrogenase family)
MSNILVTGSNRGMGLEWVRQYAELGWRVFATCRFPEEANDLAALAGQYPQISIHQLDVTRDDHLQALTEELGDTPLDILVNNAGLYFERWGQDKLGRIDYEHWLETLRVNTLGVMRVTEAFHRNLARSDKRLLVAISSHMGSITDTTTPNDYAYRSSKAALNTAMKGLAYEIEPDGIGILLLHPGWVRTRMGGEDAPYSPEQSISSMRKLVESFTPAMSGRFYRFDGEIIPW